MGWIYFIFNPSPTKKKKMNLFTLFIIKPCAVILTGLLRLSEQLKLHRVVVRCHVTCDRCHVTGKICFPNI